MNDVDCEGGLTQLLCETIGQNGLNVARVGDRPNDSDAANMGQCQQSRRARRAIDFSKTSHMRLACDQCARRKRNDDFSSTWYRD